MVGIYITVGLRMLDEVARECLEMRQEIQKMKEKIAGGLAMILIVAFVAWKVLA